MIKGLEIYLKFPRIEITSREWEAAKWRWEFLRLNEEYKKEYPGLKNQRKPIMVPTTTRWGTFAWLNPSLSFEELHKDAAEEIQAIKSHDLDIEDASKCLLLQYLGLPERAVHNIIERWPASEDRLNLLINLAYPDNEIKDQVMAWVAKHREQIKKSKNWKWDNLILYYKAISLKKSGKTSNEIADIMFPGPDPFSDDESSPEDNLDAVMRKVFRYIKTGEKLVKGEYINIK
jgi:hypothetical protein